MRPHYPTAVAHTHGAFDAIVVRRQINLALCKVGVMVDLTWPTDSVHRTACRRFWMAHRGVLRVNVMRSLLIASCLVCVQTVSAQSPEKEPAAILELGGAGSWAVKGGGSSFGPTAAVEVTPIENWLELEGGVTPLFARHSREWDTDLLFKKPWTFSKKVEFMMGVGPEWVHSTKFGMASNSISAEGALDFMFWPSAKHRFGWYVEPAYDYNFGRGREESLSVSGGLLISIP
jgi:hypothetical protein